jgi:hypothetical protein
MCRQGLFLYFQSGSFFKSAKNYLATYNRKKLAFFSQMGAKYWCFTARHVHAVHAQAVHARTMHGYVMHGHAMQDTSCKPRHASHVMHSHVMHANAVH